MSKLHTARFPETARENGRVIEELKNREALRDKKEMTKLPAETAADSGEEISAEDFMRAFDKTAGEEKNKVP